MKRLLIILSMFSTLPLARASYDKITIWGHVAGAATILNSYTIDPTANGALSAVSVSHRICLDIGRLTGRVDDLYNRNANDAAARKINALTEGLEKRCSSEQRKESFSAEEVAEIQKTAEDIIDVVYGRKK